MLSIHWPSCNKRKQDSIRLRSTAEVFQREPEPVPGDMFRAEITAQSQLDVLQQFPFSVTSLLVSYTSDLNTPCPSPALISTPLAQRQHAWWKSEVSGCAQCLLETRCPLCQGNFILMRFASALCLLGNSIFPRLSSKL